MGAKNISLNADDIAKVELFLDEFKGAHLRRGGKVCNAYVIAVEHELDAACRILAVGKGVFSHAAEEDQPAGETDVFSLASFRLFTRAGLFALIFVTEG